MADIFDAMMNTVCDILAKGNGAADGYGLESQAFSTIASAVPCRVSEMGGREFKDGKKYSVSTRKVFMRPATVTEHNWLLIGGLHYDVLAVNNPGLSNHHYELLVELVTP